MKVLAVDDDPSILEVLEAALSSLEGYDVFTAMSAAEGLEILMDHPETFDLALVDIQMPEMNGIELCREIRQLPGYSDMPIIIVTAMSQRTYIADAFKSGATDYVTKPFDLIDLRSRVTSALRQNKRGEAARRNRSNNLSEAFQLRNVTRFLGPDEYENYVMQISQSLTSKSSVVAIKMLNVQTLHEELSSRAFEEAVQTVGAAVSVLTRHEGHMISYRGHGVFLCIRIGRYDVLPDAFESVLNKQLYATKPDSLAQHPLKVCVGETTVLKSNSKAGALDTLTEAVAKVEEKAEALCTARGMSRRVLSNQSRSAEELHVDRRVYSMMLKDVMPDDESPSAHHWRQSQ